MIRNNDWLSWIAFIMLMLFTIAAVTMFVFLAAPQGVPNTNLGKIYEELTF